MSFAAKKAPSAMEMVSAVLGRVVRGLSIERELRSHAVEPAWPLAAGPRLSPHSRPARLHHGVLTVEARSAPWLHELFLMRESLRLSLNREMGGDYVRELRLKLGTGFAAPPPAQSALPGPLVARDDIEAAVETLAAAGADEGAVLAARALALARRKGSSKR